MANIINKEMIRGDSKTYALTVTDNGGTATNITGASIWFSVTADEAKPVATRLFWLRNTLAGGGDSQIKITNGLAGKAEIYITPVLTNAAQVGEYRYDVQVKLASGVIGTPVMGGFTIKVDITREI